MATNATITSDAGWQDYKPDDAGWQDYKPKVSAQPETDPGEIPLTSHLAATEQGFNRVAQGAQHAVEGAANMIMHPIDTAQSMLQPPGKLIDQIKQVPGAIRDINASEDPTGSYLQAAGRTAGEAGGQALAAIAAKKIGEGSVAGAKAAGPPMIRAGATLANKALTPRVMGTAAGSAMGGPLGAVAAEKLGRNSGLILSSEFRARILASERR